MAASLLVSIVMLAGKLTAYLLTHSTAILADAVESVVHGAATGLAAFSLWLAGRPADKEHPYGHGRIAYFSAGFEGALVFAAAVAVIYGGVRGLIHKPQLDNLGLGLAIAAGLAVVNLALGLTLVRIGRRHNALILVANGKHVLADVWTTAAAIVGVGLVMITKVEWLDPLAALLIGVLIMASGLSLVRSSIAGLMDEVDPDVSRRLVKGLQTQVEQGRIVGFHQLRCRLVNDELWVDVHVLVPGEMPAGEAHRAVSQLEEAVHSLFPSQRVHVTSHIEPADHEAAHPGGHRGVSDPLPSSQPGRDA
jgi:cation diffusion facilitator family transporter